MDPAPVLAQMEAQLQQKREAKHRNRAPSPGSCHALSLMVNAMHQCKYKVLQRIFSFSGRNNVGYMMKVCLKKRNNLKMSSATKLWCCC